MPATSAGERGLNRSIAREPLEEYAALGYKLFPCHPDKSPATPNGLTDATTDAATLGDWLATHQGSWGLLPPAGVLVLDADSIEVADQLEQDYPELTGAPCCRTPRGAHYYLRWPADVPPPPTRTRALPDTDIRGLGRAYLIAPPSKTERGIYAWERPLVAPDALPLASDALVAALTPPRPTATTQTRQNPTPGTPQGGAYARAALQREHDAVAAAPEGTRNYTLNRAAFALGQLVAGGVLERSEVTDTLMAAAATCGLPHAESARTIQSGLAAGALEPRTVPETPARRGSDDEHTPPRAGDEHATDGSPPTPGGQRRAVTVKLSDVDPEPVAWLWYPYIPLGKITLLEGDPGLGKTWLALNLAAILTRGDPFPNENGVPRGSREPARVLYLSAEDGLADTLRPRLDAVGADARRVFALTGWRATGDNGEPIEGAVTLADKAVLEQALTKHRPALMVVDPLQAYLGADVDMHRANETRPLLARLGQLAERYRCAVLAIRHLSKVPQGRAVYRGLGSIDFAAAARSILLVGEHPDDDTRRVIAHVKSSLSEQGQSLGFEFDSGQFLWTGPAGVTAEQLLGPRQTEDERSARDEARDFLEELLGNGPFPVEEAKKEAKRAGIAWRTIERVKKELGVESKRRSDGNAGDGQWFLTPTQTRGGLAKVAENDVLDTTPATPPHSNVADLRDSRKGREKAQLRKTANIVSEDSDNSATPGGVAPWEEIEI